MPTKAHIVKAMFFSSSHVWMWELEYKESWTPNNLCFELWCWRRLLRVPRTARRSNQSILKEISPGFSLEGLMLKLQYFGHLMPRTGSLEKTLILGKIEDSSRRTWQRMKWLGLHPWLSGHEFGQGLGFGDGWWSLVCYSPWDPKNQARLRDWTELSCS